MYGNFLARLLAARTSMEINVYANPWGGIKNTVRQQILNFVGDFAVPIAGVILVVIGLLQIPGCVAEHNNGHGQEFQKKILIMALCIGIGIGMNAIWLVIKAAMPT